MVGESEACMKSLNPTSEAVTDDKSDATPSYPEMASLVNLYPNINRCWWNLRV